jgi:hypothetical protein
MTLAAGELGRNSTAGDWSISTVSSANAAEQQITVKAAIAIAQAFAFGIHRSRVLTATISTARAHRSCLYRPLTKPIDFG